MKATFDNTTSYVADSVFRAMVVDYKQHIGYIEGQQILYPFADTQADAQRIVCRHLKDGGMSKSLDWLLGIANAVRALPS